MAPIASPDAFGAGPAASPAQLFDRITRALSSEDLTVTRRGNDVEIDSRVTIRMLHGIVAALPDNYRVHVTFEGGGHTREGAIGQIATRLVLQREDSRISQRLNAVRAYSFTVKNADEGAILPPRILLGYDLPSDATPFSRVEVRRTIPRPHTRNVKGGKPISNKNPQRPIAPAPSVPATSVPPGPPLVALAPHKYPRPMTAALSNKRADTLAVIADAPPSAAIDAAPTTDSDSKLPKNTAAGQPITAHRDATSDSENLDSQLAKQQPAAKEFAPALPAKIDAMQTHLFPLNVWRPEFRVVKARATGHRRTEQPPATPPQSRPVLKTATHSAIAATKAREARANRLAATIVTPLTQGNASHAQVGLPLIPVLPLALAGIAASACARCIYRRKHASTAFSDALFEAVDTLVETASVDTSPRLRLAVTLARAKALEPIDPGVVTQLLLFEETRRTAQAIRHRQASEHADRLLALVEARQRRLLTNAA